MRTAAAIVCFASLVATAAAQPASPAQTAPAAAEGDRTAIDRAAEFLAKDALAWKAEHNCASCHHAALVAWALRETKERGQSVDEPVLNEMTAWIAGAGGGKVSLPRPEGIPKAFNTKAVYFALGLGADPRPDEKSQAALKLLLATVMEDQTEDGSWHSWPDTRPPLFGHSDEAATALATLALVPTAAGGDDAATASRDRGMKWLTDHPPTGDHQGLTLRLLLLSKLGRPAAQRQSLVKRLIDSQEADGGWRQTEGMASDAFATGQALYALAAAGLKADDPPIARGREFLTKTQRADGGWTMTSRPSNANDKGAADLMPITGAGAAWGLLGLVNTEK